MKKLFGTYVLLLVCLLTQGQEQAEFTADRPGASTGPSIVGHKVIQLEQGIQYDGDGGAGTFTFSNTLLRYGLFPNMELRFGGDAFLFQPEGASQGFKTAFSGLSIGTKIKCFEGRGGIPAVSVLADFSIPGTATEGFNVDYFAPSLYLLFENPINDWFSVGYNVGVEWDGIMPAPTTFAALCIGFSVAENLGCFVESYNYFHKIGNAYCMDLGLNWQVSRKVQLDVAANMDLTNPSQCWAISCGVAWQINR
jgi:hypothetical protein